MTAQDQPLLPARQRSVTLLDLADRLLDKGVCIAGDLVISVAGVDLVYLNLRAFLASAEKALEAGEAARQS